MIEGFAFGKQQEKRSKIHLKKGRSSCFNKRVWLPQEWTVWYNKRGTHRFYTKARCYKTWKNSFRY